MVGIRLNIMILKDLLQVVLEMRGMGEILLNLLNLPGNPMDHAAAHFI